ncbi:unnamed protein product [Oppiella nova]|uniref:Nuclear hormone receptor HR96 n=1 Tax=Oppiella nova TaxID=334625 RepID=A0A7R9QTN0_9ACAR|nr:unnamed protein product [Oppiella nova]CAG2173965.1 unnamed protein product [Oppiella nova]
MEMNDKELSKICGICGDKALGYNFNAITCESCKAFFRRNALRNKEFKCPFDGNCKIDLVTRRFCQRCRLKKCFDIGMKKEWILSEEEKVMKRSKIAENRKRRHDGTDVTKGADSTTTTPVVDTNIPSMDNSNNVQTLSPDFNVNLGRDMLLEVTECTAIEVTQTIMNPMPVNMDLQVLNNVTDCHKNNYINSINSDENFRTKMDNISRMDEMNDIPEIVYRKAIELEFASIPIRKTMNETNANYFEFNDLERNKLTELLNAMAVMKDQFTAITSEVTGILDALKMTDQTVRQLIKMSKRMVGFKSLCQHDQIALLKGGCTELIILRSVVSYNYEREYYTIVMDSNNATLIKLDVLKQAKGNVYEAHKKFMHAFKSEWDSDTTIIDLLIAITLFSPERRNIINKDTIKLEQQVYMYLLQRYLEIKYYSKCEAKSKFLRLMTKLEELHLLNEDHIRMYLDAGSANDFGPLLLEIFDLPVSGQ